MKIVVAGASGYIGKALIPKLLERYPHCEIIALSRSAQSSKDSRVIWRACDLFSLDSVVDCLPDSVDAAFYLVHSMGPTAKLDQGSFADYDLLLADNFARALSKIKVKQLIYLGGLIPVNSDLSLHLQSRLEVEKTFLCYKLPVTIFRAGLIIGSTGSSFQILLKLVSRLPVMICPKWTQTLTTPVDLASVLFALVDILSRTEQSGRIYDLASCEPLAYIEMMRATAARLGRKRYFFNVSFFTPTLSRLWVSLITGASKNLVYPLIESLEHPMVARQANLYALDKKTRTYGELLETVDVTLEPRHKKPKFEVRGKTVRSIQRLTMPSGSNASWLVNQYLDWLPKAMFPLIRVYRMDQKINFSLFASRPVLLQLAIMEKISDSHNQTLSIKAGLLVAKGNRGRLEFREVLDRKFALAAIHDFTPSLPWIFYKYTQAILHLWVMKAFNQHLQNILRSEKSVKTK